MTQSTFAEVYAQSLEPVWRFVRARVPDHQEAQDVTSDVFTRAWDSWSNYDPSQGRVTAWLCGIARRVVADWWRRQEREGHTTTFSYQDDSFVEEALLRDAQQETVEGVMIKREQLGRLRDALLLLKGREREALALRFGAGLRVREIGELLDLSSGATKMMIHRALKQLRAVLAVEGVMLPVKSHEEEAAELLDRTIDAVLARRQPEIADPILEHLLAFMVEVHQPPVPHGLPDHVAYCIDCAAGLEDQRRKSEMAKGNSKFQGLLARVGLAAVPGVGWLSLAPVCLSCTVPLLGTAILTANTFGVVLATHFVSLLTAPLVLFILVRHFRWHRNRLVMVLGGVGVGLLMLHLTLHLVAGAAGHLVEAAGHLVEAAGEVTFLVADQAGTALLMAAVALNFVIAVRAKVIQQKLHLPSTRDMAV